MKAYIKKITQWLESHLEPGNNHVRITVKNSNSSTFDSEREL